MFKLLRLCLILAACLFLAQGVRAEFSVTVVSSDSSQYKPGKTLKENDRITLKKDQNIILDHKGEKRSFTGLSKLVKTLKEFFGVKRGGLSERWLVDVLRGDVFCYKKEKPVMLGRSEANVEETITLFLKLAYSANEPVEVILPAEEKAWAWPMSELPIIDGQKYEVKIESQSAGKYLTFYQLPSDNEFPSDPDNLFWMKEKGCDRQVDLLTAVD